MTGGAGGSGGFRVLVIEDNLAHARFIRRVLETMDRPVQVSSAGRVASACERLRAELFDFIVADLHLPDGQGPTVVVRLMEVAPTVPILVVSALDDPAMAQLAMAAGAHDYLTKERLTPELLSHALVRAGQREASRGATTSGGALLDPATGVFSASGIELAAAKALALARRKGHPVTVVHVSIGGTPSEVAEVVRLVAGTVRDADLVGRIGESRIALVLPDDQSDPPAVLGRIAERLASSSGSSGSLAHVELTTEVRRFDPESAVPASELLRVGTAGPSALSERQHRVLVVSDDPSLVGEVDSALGARWTAFSAAAAGPAARVAALEEPQLVVVDLGTAGGTGLEIVHAIGSQPESAAIPIIGILAAGEEGGPSPAGVGRVDGMVARLDRRRLLADLSYAAGRLVP